MKNTLLCLLSLALLCTPALADGQQTATYDSLNVRVHWTFLGIREFGGLAMAPDTTLWTCYPGTNTLIEVDASNPEAIDTNFYEMDSTLGAVLEVVDDSLLLIMNYNLLDGTYWLRTININSSPPSIVASYTSNHLSYKYYQTASRIINDMYFTMDRQSIGDLAIFDLSDPMNIDTIATAIDRGTGKWFEIVDTFLYASYFEGEDLGGGYYHNTYKIKMINISNIHTPFYDTTLSFISATATGPTIPCPSVIVDTLMFVAANYYEGPLADVYNISDPTNPVHLGEIGVHSFMYDKYVITHENGYLYSGMWIHDITDYPTDDSLVGYITGTPEYQEVSGKYIYRMQASSFTILEFYGYDTLHVYTPEINTPPKPGIISLSAYPNPFNSAVTISIDTPVGAGLRPARVEIFDIAGRRAAQLPSPSIPLPAGEGGNSFSLWEKVSEGRMRAKLTWQPDATVASGVYLVRASFDGESVSKRIVYLK